MKNLTKSALLVCGLVTTAVAHAAIADYSGVYQATVSSYKISAGVTKGGRIAGGGFINTEDADVINPVYSYVRSDGTFTGRTLGGNSLSGKFTKTTTTVTCTLKALGKTSTLKRTYQ